MSLEEPNDTTVYRVQSPDSRSQAIADAKKEFAERHDRTYDEVTGKKLHEGWSSKGGFIDVAVGLYQKS